jgi:hypothetical protein
MNKRIKLLAKQADIDYDLRPEIARAPVWIGTDEELERFARLIVKECADFANDHNSEVEGVTLGVGRALKQHFGVAE